MKKIDKLILDSFIGPFILTFLVVVFILLMQHMLKYFDDIIGKDLGWDVLGQLLFYFAIFMTPVAMPLAVLLSSLITFGNLGEHFELTAIKASGISLLRTLRPIFFFVILLTGFAFYINNNLVPKAALEAYSLLYDIKQKKPALDLREGAFYMGIPDISIKVNKKFPDGKTIKGVVIYDHRKNEGNKQVTVADSGRMFTILNDRYLKLELFKGYEYGEGSGGSQEVSGMASNSNAESLRRSKFAKMQVVFDLSSFQMSHTDKKWFQGNRIMRNLSELDGDIDSIKREVLSQRLSYYVNKPNYFTYYRRNDAVILPPEVIRYRDQRDSIVRAAYMKQYDKGDTVKKPLSVSAKPPVENPMVASPVVIPPVIREVALAQAAKKNNIKAVVESPAKKKRADSLLAVYTIRHDSIISHRIDSLIQLEPSHETLQASTSTARQVQSQLMNTNSSVENYTNDMRTFEIQWHKIIANSMACIAMFLIGAPLGAIIKKGGLGVPFLISIMFFIIFYVMNMIGEKWAKQGTVSVTAGVWIADLILFIIGVLFLRQARVDARLFDTDFYLVVFEKVKRWYKNRKAVSLKTT